MPLSQLDQIVGKSSTAADDKAILWKFWRWVKDNATIELNEEQDNSAQGDYYRRAINAQTSTEFKYLIDSGFMGRDEKYIQALKFWNDMNPNKDNFVDRRELKKAFGGSDQAITDYLNKADNDNDQKISLEEFLDLLGVSYRPKA